MQPKETTVPYLTGLLGGLNEVLITVCRKHSKVTNIMGLFSPITMLLLARTLARGRKSVSNLAHLTEKSRGVPASGITWSWDSTGIVRLWSLSLFPPLHLVSPSSGIAPVSDKLSLYGGKTVTASPYIHPGLSPAGKNVAYTSVEPAQTWDFSRITPVQIIALHFTDYWQGWVHFHFHGVHIIKGC